MDCDKIINDLRNEFERKRNFVYTKSNITEITREQFEVIEYEVDKLKKVNSELQERTEILEAIINDIKSKNPELINSKLIQ